MEGQASRLREALCARSRAAQCLENGPFSDQEWVRNGSKTRFSESDHGPFGLHKQMKAPHFDPVSSHFGPSQILKKLDNGLFLGQKWGKNESKMCFSKSDRGPIGVLARVNNTHLEPVLP